jgi:hypothetical protein
VQQLYQVSHLFQQILLRFAFIVSLRSVKDPKSRPIAFVLPLLPTNTGGQLPLLKVRLFFVSQVPVLTEPRVEVNFSIGMFSCVVGFVLMVVKFSSFLGVCVF